jgi:hypothetical protein
MEFSKERFDALALGKERFDALADEPRSVLGRDGPQLVGQSSSAQSGWFRGDRRRGRMWVLSTELLGG